MNGRRTAQGRVDARLTANRGRARNRFAAAPSSRAVSRLVRAVELPNRARIPATCTDDGPHNLPRRPRQQYLRHWAPVSRAPHSAYPVSRSETSNTPIVGFGASDLSNRTQGRADTETTFWHGVATVYAVIPPGPQFEAVRRSAPIPATRCSVPTAPYSRLGALPPGVQVPGASAGMRDPTLGGGGPASDHGRDPRARAST